MEYDNNHFIIASRAYSLHLCVLSSRVNKSPLLQDASPHKAWCSSLALFSKLVVTLRPRRWGPTTMDGCCAPRSRGKENEEAKRGKPPLGLKRFGWSACVPRWRVRVLHLAGLCWWPFCHGKQQFTFRVAWEITTKSPDLALANPIEHRRVRRPWEQW
jgi:hypothetical protein